MTLFTFEFCEFCKFCKIPQNNTDITKLAKLTELAKFTKLTKYETFLGQTCFCGKETHISVFSKNRPLADSFIESQCPLVCVYPKCLSPSHAIFFEASNWPSDHMTRSRPLIGGQKWTPKVAVKSGPQK